jgi:hypothetical protein
VVPPEKRPANKSFEQKNLNTTVLRMTLDSRFCHSVSWKKLKATPAVIVRQWIKEHAPPQRKL